MFVSVRQVSSSIHYASRAADLSSLSQVCSDWLPSPAAFQASSHSGLALRCGLAVEGFPGPREGIRHGAMRGIPAGYSEQV